MNNIVIKAEGISKSYLIGHQSKEKYVALRDVISKGFIGSRSQIEGKNLDKFSKIVYIFIQGVV